jgi:uncharacterized protein YdeI (YjbR/CyaY-like superfamily)
MNNAHSRGRDVDVPEDFAEALRSKPVAATKWQTLSEGHRRAHVAGILQAKDPEMRAQRIQQTVEHLLEE